MLKYFKKAENNKDYGNRNNPYHSQGGPLNVERFPYTDKNAEMLVQAFKEKGLPITDFNGKNQIGTNIGQSTSKDGRRMSANTAYIQPIKTTRSNLKIINEAYVIKILFNHENNTAMGVQFIKHGALRRFYSKKEVIVSAGSLNSPKLLMLSGIGPKNHLENLNIPVVSDLKVGENLQDHVTTVGLNIQLSNMTSTLVNEKMLLNEISKHYNCRKSKKKGPLAATGPTNGIAFIKTKLSAENAPDIQFHFDGNNVRELYSDPTNYIATNIFPLSFYDGLTCRPILLKPKSRGYLHLNQTNPIFGAPLIYSRFFTERHDVETLLEGVRYLLTLESTNVFKNNGAKFIKTQIKGCEDFTWGSDGYLECLLIQYTATIFHPVGTCKMGPTWDKDAVVSPGLKVHGVDKLRIIDASVMPEIVRGNLNAPTIMIAEKACDLIKGEYFK